MAPFFKELLWYTKRIFRVLLSVVKAQTRRFPQPPFIEKGHPLCIRWPNFIANSWYKNHGGKLENPSNVLLFYGKILWRIKKAILFSDLCIVWKIFHPPFFLFLFYSFYISFITYWLSIYLKILYVLKYGMLFFFYSIFDLCISIKE